jgi:hypothetical protein
MVFSFGFPTGAIIAPFIGDQENAEVCGPALFLGEQALQ